MAVISRTAYVIAGALFLGGCVSTATAISETQRLVSAEPIQAEFIVTTSAGVQQTWSPAGVDGHEKAYLGYVLLDSGKKCQAFADRLSVAQRGVDTSFDILTGILSALATALTPITTIHALTAAATISSGTKTAIDANVYAKATAALILQEINRTYYVHINNYRNELLATPVVVPAIEVSRIEAIHRECSLDFAVASLSQTGAAAAASIGAASGAIAAAAVAKDRGLTPEAGAIVGAAAGAAAGAATGGAAGMSQTAARAGAEAGANIIMPSGGAGVPGPGMPPPAPLPAAAAPRPLQPPPPIPPVPLEHIGSAQNGNELALSRPFGQRIQLALCLAPDSPEYRSAEFGRETRAAIQSWRSVRASPAAGGLSARETSDLLRERPCDRAQYRSAFERFVYDSAPKIIGLQRALAAALGGAPPVPESGMFDDPTRTAIRALQHLKNLPETGIVTRQLVDTMAQ